MAYPNGDVEIELISLKSGAIPIFSSKNNGDNMKFLSTHLIITFFFLISYSINAQWQTEYISPSLNYSNVSGWLNFQKAGDNWNSRLYVLDENSFNVMSDVYSTSPQFTYTFTQAEKDGGYLIYSLQQDLTNDNITEFYVLSSYGSASPYRQSVKIFNIVDNSIILELNNNSYYYDTPTIWDVDNDGILECMIARYDYPNFSNYNLFVYDTGINTSISNEKRTQIRFSLKQNYPNPFNPNTTIEFDLDKSSNVSIDIYSINGELVKSILSNNLSVGNHKINWDGSSDSGTRLSSGVYFYKLTVDNTSITKKMLLLK